MDVQRHPERSFQTLDSQDRDPLEGFELAMLLVFFVISIAGFLLFTVLFIIYAANTQMSKVEKTSKVFIGFFMFVNISELTINGIKYYYGYTDKN